MKKKKYAAGGDLQSPNGLDMLSMGLSLIPGWGQVASPALGLVSGLVKKQQAEKELRNTVITGTPGNFAEGGDIMKGLTPLIVRRQKNNPDYKVVALKAGGDIPLSSKSFQVKGNENVTDGNNYNYKGSQIALDHDEVVDTEEDFVFSDDIINPLTKRSFAKDAARLERSSGKAEKQVIRDGSQESKNTVKYHEKAEADLASLQELVKSVSGVAPNKATMKYAAGGPLPWEGFGVREFQQFASSQGYVDPTTGKPIGVDNSWGPQSQAAFKALGDTWAGKLGMSNVGGKYTRTAPINIVNNPQGMSVLNPADPSKFASWDANRPSWQGLPQAQNVPNYLTTPDGEQVDITELGGNATPKAVDRASLTTPFVAQDGESFPMTDVPKQALAAPGSNKMSGAIGDALQGIEVMSKFFGTMSPAEHQRPYLDNTQITKQSYDPRPALQQNDRSYQNALSSLSTPSINLRRALSSNMYASKLNADEQVISQYDSMNKQAKSQYEGAVSNKVRYNNQQMFAADDTNSRNRAAKDQAVQNAFTSLGNFGEALNNKDQAYSSLGLLKELYPDVYDRIINQYNTKTKGKTN